jgi:uncharacterized membrane protein YedE/YeeE
MSFTPWAALAGGALIGLSATALLVLSGRVAGISSILAALAQPVSAETSWKIAFLAGLVAGGLGLAWRWPGSLASSPQPSTTGGTIVVAGLLVGIGTQLAGGCTSGHGVCGLARLSRRSLVAVPVFMTAGVVATFVVRHVLRGAG